MAEPTTAVEAMWTLRDYLYSGGVFIAVISASIAGYSAVKTAKRDLNSLGDSEIKTFEMIAKAEKDFAEFNAKILDKKANFDANKNDSDSDSDSDEKFTLTKADDDLSNFYTQSVLNAYEIACQRYLDGKLDKDRFKKTYAARLKKLCARPAYRPFIKDGDFNYSALVQVNTALNNPEIAK